MSAKKNVNSEEVIAMYRNGMTTRDIAKALEISPVCASYHLRKNGIKVGQGRRNPFKGGAVADTIPRVEYVVPEEEIEEKNMQELAVKNASNACLVVQDSVTTLEGVLGHYEVSQKLRKVYVTIMGEAITLEFNQVASFAEELRALARNVVGMEELGNVMW